MLHHNRCHGRVDGLTIEASVSADSRSKLMQLLRGVDGFASHSRCLQMLRFVDALSNVSDALVDRYPQLLSYLIILNIANMRMHATTYSLFQYYARYH